MPRHVRYRPASLLVAGLAILLTACAGGTPPPAAPAATPTAPAAAPSSDGRVVVYSGRSESLMAPVMQKFTAATGIAVEARYAGTAAMATQLLEEGSGTGADVFLAQDAGALGAVAKAGLFTPLPPEVTGRVPAQYRSASGEWTGVTARARVLAYNPTLVPTGELPASVFDLTGPQWRGKVGVAPTNASFQAFVTAVVVDQGEARAKEFLAGLAANEPQIREGNAQILEDIDAGLIPVGLINHYYLGEIAAERGVAPEAMTAKLHFFGPGDPGALVNVAGVGLLEKADPDPDGRAFVDYLLGTEAQTYFAQETFEYPVVAGNPAPAYAPALESIQGPSVDLDQLDQLETTVALIAGSGLVP